MWYLSGSTLFQANKSNSSHFFHRMKLHLYTFPSKLRLKIYTFPRNQHLYFIPVLIYTLIKVKSKLREEKKWIRQTDQPICRSPPMILPIFLLAAKSS